MEGNGIGEIQNKKEKKQIADEMDSSSEDIF